MRLGIVGLGRMGLNMARRLLRSGHEVVAYNRSPGAVDVAADEGAVPAYSLVDLAAALSSPRVAWVMVPAGEATATTIRSLAALFEEGDTIVDGGNSKWKDTVALGHEISANGVDLVDCGTSGGVWGLEEGYCLMAGGSEEAYRRIEPALESLAPPGGYARVGPAGAGHFLKMVHNGVEYGLMQSYAEGMEILDRSEYDYDLGEVASLWRKGSVVRSWLLDLLSRALTKDPRLTEVAPHVDDSGEGRWTVQAAIHESVPAPTITAALYARFYSRVENSFGARVLAALRREFGGHEVIPPK